MLQRYVPQSPPAANLRGHVEREQQRVRLSLDSLIELLKALDVPVEIGPADSAGVGFRALRIPN